MTRSRILSQIPENYSNTVNASYGTANNAYANATFANTVAIAAFDQANTGGGSGPAFDQANAAYTRANTANSVPVSNTIQSNGYSTVRATRNEINFVEGTNVTINVDDDAAGDRANVTITASAGSDPAAGLAFDKANAANITAEAAFDQANTVWDSANNNYTFAANTVRLIANTAYDKANAANITADASSVTSSAAYDKANAANILAETAQTKGEAAHETANTTYTYAANNVMLVANTSFDSANSNYTYAANNVMLVANSAYSKANTANITADSAQSDATQALSDAAAAFDQANTVWDSANSNYTFAANTVRLIANTAYDKANAANITADAALPKAGGTITGDLVVQGNTTISGNTTFANTETLLIGDNIVELNTDLPHTVAPSEDAGIQVNRGSAAANVSILWNEADDVWTFTNDETTFYAIPTNTSVESAQTDATAAFVKANAVYDSANSNYTYAANDVMLAANSAFAMANAANLMPVGNTIAANGYYTNRATRRAINFIEGTNVTINVDDDPTLNTANVTITGIHDTTIAEASFDQANTVWDSANSNYTFAANTVRLIANTAYDKANAANITADTADAQSIAAFDQANTVWDSANNNYTYASNNVMLAANSAFAMANAANLMPVGNTIAANGYYTNRATRRAVNFIEGAGITINVDDDPTLNTANVTITGSAGDTTIAEAAFDQANTVWDSANSNYTFAANTVRLIANTAYDKANVVNIGNSGTTVQYQERANQRAINFVEGTDIRINVDQDDSLETVNVRITSIATEGASAADAFDKANLAYTIAANDVQLIANSAYGEANVTMNVGNTTAGTWTPRAKRRALNFLEGSGITITIDDDETLNTANVTITSTGGDTTIAEAAFDQANTVWDSANGNYTYASNNVMLAANSAFAMANAANLMPVGNTIAANGYYTNRATRRAINFIEGTNVTINVDDDPTLNTANVTITATDTGITAVEVANTIQDNGYSTIRSTRDQINFLEDESIKITVNDDAAGDRANVTITSPAAASAYAKANAANITADTADAQSIAAFDQANTVWDSANNNYTYAANNVMLAANSAFAMANAANLMPVGNTIASNSYYTNRATRRGINFLEGSNITINVDDDPTLNTANVTITGTHDTTIAEAAFDQANVVWDSANSNYTYAANDVMIAANSAFAMANAANLMPVGNTISSNGYYTNRATRRAINFLEGDGITINVDDDPTLNTANVTITGHDTTIAVSAFDQANTVWDSANNNYTYAANNVMLAANSAFAMANAANLMPVGNTIAANGYYTNRATRRGLNFIEGSNITINVDDDPTINVSNITITGIHDTTIAVAAFDQANTVWDSANSNYTFAANTVRLIANTAYAAGNSNYTFAANNVMIAANSAFAMANAANLIPVGNTITSNSYYTNRATRRGINFVEGSGITINVDDDPTLNTANVTITGAAGDTTIAEAAFDQANTVWDSANNNYTYAANNVMLAANSAFAMANAANLMPVGNTIAANGYYTNRATRRAINFIEGTNVTINVDDDPTLNTANVTITSTGGGGGANVHVSDSSPGSPEANTMWWHSNLGKMFIYYDDGDTSQWVESSPGLVSANGSGGTFDYSPAFNKANAAYTFAANDAMLAANSAFAMANAANLMPVGNTITSNSYYTNRATRRAINFVEGSGITINVDDDPTLNTANVTITGAAGDTTIAEAAFDQANTVWDSANSNYTYAANNVMLAANSAFAMANAANLMPVGNTIAANGYYTNRATRRNINFIEGTNVTINVDDDPTLNTANVTITATDTGITAVEVANTIQDNGYSTIRSTRDQINFLEDESIKVTIEDDAAGDRANVTITSPAAAAAYGLANSNYTYAANNVMLAANSAFAMANAANLMPVGNTITSNSYYTNRATRRGINFVEGSGITINVDDDPTLNTANVTITGAAGDTTIAEAAFDQANTVWDSANNNYTYAANNVMLAANSAFAMANAANLMPVGNTIAANGYYTNRATRRAINFVEGSGITINVDDDPTLNTANVTITGAAGDTTIAEAAFDQANTVWDSANNNYTYAANNVMLAANSAFAMANAANLMPVGNTIAANGYYTNRATRRAINFVEGSGITINVDDDPTLNTANVTITGAAGDTTIAEAAFDQANTVWDSANSNYTYAANDVMIAANSAFAMANAANLMPVGNTIAANGYYTNRATRRGINFIEGTNVTINVDDDPTLNTANITITATDTGITAIEVANTIQDNGYSTIRATRDQINFLEDESIKITVNDDAAGDRANVTITSPAAAAAYGLANSNYTYAANDVMIAANSAFAMANAANLMPVGNTITSNSYYTNRATRRGINFVEGSGITINVDDDPTLNTANVTITGAAGDTTIAEAAFDQANTVWDSANSNYTYAANDVMIAANSAFAMANAANLMPVGNTITSNSYYTNRATRRGINFVEGSGITINVDDDPTLNTANVTITGAAGDTTIAEAAFDQANTVWDSANSNYTYAANDVMIAANSAFAMANAANLMPVGNTITSNSYYTNRATRRGINFVEGSGITINVDDDPTLNTANVTITGAAGDTTIAEAAFDQANTVWDSANSNYTYAANDVMIAANSAFAMANAANLMPVGNTISSNNYYTNRATRRGINFLEGTGITINVDDDATLNTANVTVTSTDSVTESKAISIVDPAVANITLFCANSSVSITRLAAVCVGSTPSVTYRVRYASDRSSTTPTDVVTGGSTATSTTTGNIVTTFNNNTPAAANFIWIYISAVSGTVNEFHLTVDYNKT